MRRPPALRPIPRPVAPPLPARGVPGRLARWGGGALTVAVLWPFLTGLGWGALEGVPEAWVQWGALALTVLILGALRWLDRPTVRARRRLAQWTRTARRSGWAVAERGADHATLTHAGARGPLRLTLHTDPDAQVSLTVRPIPAPPQAVAQVRVGRAVIGAEAVGDARLDHSVGVQGDPAVWRTLWDAPARALLARWAEGEGLTLADGAVRLALIHVGRGVFTPGRALSACTTLAQTLVYEPGALPGRLADEVAHADTPLATGALAALLRHAPEHPAVAVATAAVRRRARRDGWLALAAGTLLADPSLLRPLLAHTEGPLVREAALALGAALPAHEAVGVLTGLLSHPNVQGRAGALEALAACRGPIDLSLQRALAADLPVVLDALLIWLDALAPVDAEPTWIALLGRPHPPAVDRALTALAGTGSPAAIPAILAVADTRPHRKAARRALAAIRARLPADVAHGGLALVAPEGGGLALAREGDLSLAEGAAPETPPRAPRG